MLVKSAKEYSENLKNTTGYTCSLKSSQEGQCPKVLLMMRGKALHSLPVLSINEQVTKIHMWDHGIQYVLNTDESHSKFS